MKRYCDLCKQELTGGPDPCIGRVPGVLGACCGHGNRRAYVLLRGYSRIAKKLSKTRISCESATEVQEVCKEIKNFYKK